MRILLAVMTLAVFGMISAVASAGEGNRFVKGAKSYQRSLPVDDRGTKGAADRQAEPSDGYPQDIAPAAGAAQENRPAAKAALARDMKLPRK